MVGLVGAWCDRFGLVEARSAVWFGLAMLVMAMRCETRRVQARSAVWCGDARLGVFGQCGIGQCMVSGKARRGVARLVTVWLFFNLKTK